MLYSIFTIRYETRISIPKFAMKPVDDSSVMYRPLSSRAQSAYAELAEEAQLLSMLPLAAVNGSFAEKAVGKRTYIYFQFRSTDGSARMAYVGPKDERTERLIVRFHEAKVARTANDGLRPAVRAALAQGCVGMPEKHFKVLQKLAAFGFFQAGGVLIGTHSFVAMGNMLGVRWQRAFMTMDIDFAHAGKCISIALPADMRLSVHDALTSLEMGLLPLRELSGKEGGQYRNPRDPELRVDFLTPYAGSEDALPVNNLGIALQPLRFMELSLEDPVQAVVMGPSDAITVNIPRPARYAIHKLLVAGERPITEQTKTLKDLDQSGALIEWHVNAGRADEIAEVWRDVSQRGPGWLKRAVKGRAALAKKYPALDLGTLIDVEPKSVGKRARP